MPTTVTVTVEEGWMVSGSKAVLAIPQGGTVNRAVFQWGTQASATDPFVPVNLSSMTARMVVRPFESSTTKYLDLTTANGGITMDASGFISLNITAAQAAAVPPGTAVYEIEIYSGSTTYKFAKGAYVVGSEVVKAD